YSCLVKAVYDTSGEYDVINYAFYIGQTESIQKNRERVYSTMKGPHDYLKNNPIEAKLLRYFIRNTKKIGIKFQGRLNNGWSRYSVNGCPPP
ncbi:MAG: hypothetical protein IJU00_06580, partial [Selenomonas sp.]|nr:hypothetical protein [Selenomonas sp.]